MPIPTPPRRLPPDYSVTPSPDFDEQISAEFRLAVEIGWLQRAIATRLERRPSLLLDLGCGSKRHYGLLADSVVGVDLDVEALQSNRSLTRAITADVSHYDPGTEIYDVVACWNVLEHIREPTSMIIRMSNALKTGGLLILAFPNVASPRGLITRLTPTFIHRAARRHILGIRDSGPFPTAFQRAHHPTRLLTVANEVRLKPIHIRAYEGYYERRLREVHPTGYKVWNAVGFVLSMISFGRIDQRSDVLVAFEKS